MTRPHPDDLKAATDLELILALWRNPRTKDVALELADQNRAAAQGKEKP